MAAGFVTHVTFRLTAKNRDQLRNHTLAIEYGLPLLLSGDDFEFRPIWYLANATNDSTSRNRQPQCTRRVVFKAASMGVLT